jgi:hypothetical protein
LLVAVAMIYLWLLAAIAILYLIYRALGKYPKSLVYIAALIGIFTIAMVWWSHMMTADHGSKITQVACRAIL